MNDNSLRTDVAHHLRPWLRPGDPYPVAESLIVDGVTTMMGCLFGSPFGTILYFGHPAFKKTGATSGYRLVKLEESWRVLTCSVYCEKSRGADKPIPSRAAIHDTPTSSRLVYHLRLVRRGTTAMGCLNSGPKGTWQSLHFFFRCTS